MSFIIQERKDFSDQNRGLRFQKQKSKCALCDKNLVFNNRDKGTVGAWHAHHIDGDNDNNDIGNCACVCINEPNCHLKAHGGNFTTGTLLPKSEFTLER